MSAGQPRRCTDSSRVVVRLRPYARPMNRREGAFLALTVIGFVVPNTMVAAYLIDHGGMAGYLDAWFDSLPAAQLAVDLGIVFVSFTLFAWWEGMRLGMRSWWVPIPAS